jgi:hypothetical protein
MKFISATAAAKALGRDRSRVKILCAQGRIKGAVKVGRSWVIPSPVIRLPIVKKRKAA